MSFLASKDTCKGLTLVTNINDCSIFCNRLGECDNAIYSFCNNDTTQLTKFPAVCANYMQSDYYNSIIADLTKLYQGISIGSTNVICWFPQSSTAKYLTQVQKIFAGRCPEVVNCFQSINFNNTGSIAADNIKFTNIAACGIVKGSNSTPSDTNDNDGSDNNSSNTTIQSVTKQIWDVYFTYQTTILFIGGLIAFLLIMMLIVSGFRSVQRDKLIQQLQMQTQVQSVEMERATNILKIQIPRQ